MKKLLINLKDWFGLQENKIFAKNCKDMPVIIFPSYPYLYIYKDEFEIGSQNISLYEEGGAHTGCISINHLLDFNIKWAMLNHKERPNEPKCNLKTKIEISCSNGLNTLICFESIDSLREILDILSEINYPNIYLAYEPIDEFNIKDIDDNIKLIKTLLNASTYKLIYGGNISTENIKECNSLDVDGLLISRTALAVDELKYIVQNTTEK